MTLSNHIATGVTTLCYCWVIRRRDDVTIGFTDHDEDVVVEGVTCYATTGITTTKFQKSLGLSDDNLDIDGVIDNDMLLAEDLRTGIYDEADATLYLVNWSDPSQFDILSRGRIGTVTDNDIGMFTAEFRSDSDQLGQPTGRLYQRTCGTHLGTPECGVNLELAAYKLTTTVSALTGHVVTVSGAGAYGTDWFGLGTLVHEPTGAEFRIRKNEGNTVYLWTRPRFAMSSGDTVTLRAGCRRTSAVCRDKFANILNFRGFPFMPGNDYLAGYPIRSVT